MFLRATVVAAAAIAFTPDTIAHADTTYGPGTYAVPVQLPYGIYVARNQPGVYPGCMFATYTDEGKVIDVYNGMFMDSLTAQILSPAIAKFVTDGCTPWVKVR